MRSALMGGEKERAEEKETPQVISARSRGREVRPGRRIDQGWALAGPERAGVRGLSAEIDQRGKE